MNFCVSCLLLEIFTLFELTCLGIQWMVLLLKGTINIFLQTPISRWPKIKSIVFPINSNRHSTSVSKMTSAGTLCRIMSFFLPDRYLLYHHRELTVPCCFPLMPHAWSIVPLSVSYNGKEEEFDKAHCSPLRRELGLSANITRDSSRVLLNVTLLLCSPTTPNVNTLSASPSLLWIF